jgi:hypothetical protein
MARQQTKPQPRAAVPGGAGLLAVATGRDRRNMQPGMLRAGGSAAVYVQELTNAIVCVSVRACVRACVIQFECVRVFFDNVCVRVCEHVCGCVCLCDPLCVCVSVRA